MGKGLKCYVTIALVIITMIISAISIYADTLQEAQLYNQYNDSYIVLDVKNFPMGQQTQLEIYYCTLNIKYIDGEEEEIQLYNISFDVSDDFIEIECLTMYFSEYYYYIEYSSNELISRFYDEYENLIDSMYINISLKDICNANAVGYDFIGTFMYGAYNYYRYTDFYTIVYNMTNTSQYYEIGYNQGYSNGYAKANADNSANETYNYLQEDRETEPGTFAELIFACFNAPINIVRNMLNFNILGVNMGAFVVSIFSALLVVIIIKFIVNTKL